MINVNKGLTKDEVKFREKNGLVNKKSITKTKSIFEILRSNIFTLFNLINFILAFLVISVGAYKDLFFLLIVLLNLFISLVNEFRAKSIIDKLTILTASKAKVIRDEKETNIDIHRIVKDDIILYSRGDQIVVDSVIRDGEVEVNESLITGEEKPIFKKKGHTLLSGSFIVSGHATCQVVNIGEDNFASRIVNESKYIKKNPSEILKSFNNILKVITLLLIPLGIFFFIRQREILNYTDSILNTVAALDGMIPNGLVLLTSTVMILGVIRLSKYKVLVQELYSIENLARVDTVCLDKTGTLTEGVMEVFDVIPYKRYKKENMEIILEELSCALKDDNATLKAIKRRYKGPLTWKVKQKISFSSKNKYSGVIFEDEGTYIIGAGEILNKDDYSEIKGIVDKYSKEYRVLVLVKDLKKEFDGKLDKVKVLGFVLIQDKLRKNSKKLFDYLKKQEIDVKIISGDSIVTIFNIAERVGIEGIKAKDMTGVKLEEIPNFVKKYNVFGRVAPEQKKAIIKALKNEERKVAMTGDGVNDILALKEADCSIVMAGGSAAAKNVSDLVLLDSNFDHLPKIIAEGRRVIGNVEKVGALFLGKTIYNTLLTLLFLLIALPYPFSPYQISLISLLTIGIPAFLLGLRDSKEKVEDNFLKRILVKSLPCGVSMSFAIILLILFEGMFKLTSDEVTLIGVLLLGFISFVHLKINIIPFKGLSKALFIGLFSIYLVLLFFIPSYLEVIPVTLELFLLFLIIFSVAILIYLGIFVLFRED